MDPSVVEWNYINSVFLSIHWPLRHRPVTIHFWCFYSFLYSIIIYSGRSKECKAKRIGKCSFIYTNLKVERTKSQSYKYFRRKTNLPFIILRVQGLIEIGKLPTHFKSWCGRSSEHVGIELLVNRSRSIEVNWLVMMIGVPRGCLYWSEVNYDTMSMIGPRSDMRGTAGRNGIGSRRASERPAAFQNENRTLLKRFTNDFTNDLQTNFERSVL